MGPVEPHHGIGLEHGFSPRNTVVAVRTIVSVLTHLKESLGLGAGGEVPGRLALLVPGVPLGVVRQEEVHHVGVILGGRVHEGRKPLRALIVERREGGVSPPAEEGFDGEESLVGEGGEHEWREALQIPSIHTSAAVHQGRHNFLMPVLGGLHEGGELSGGVARVDGGGLRPREQRLDGLHVPLPRRRPQPLPHVIPVVAAHPQGRTRGGEVNRGLCEAHVEGQVPGLALRDIRGGRGHERHMPTERRDQKGERG
jgi:hypothetical protein